MSTSTKRTVTQATRAFKQRRDALLHDDESTFDTALKRFVTFCERDDLVGGVLPGLPSTEVPVWWEAASQWRSDVTFPEGEEEEYALRWAVLKYAAQEQDRALHLGYGRGSGKRDAAVSYFRTVVVRPLVEEMGNRLAEAANLATPEAREIQAVPLARIPTPQESRIFMSHKSADKAPVVLKYYETLKLLGLDPWLDDPDMPAGTVLDRGIVAGFNASCAAVFFVTENFVDERFLADEINYAKVQEREKGPKFVIVTLRFSKTAEIPDLLKPYKYVDVENDLDGFRELVRALPLEVGPPRWRKRVVDASE